MEVPKILLPDKEISYLPLSYYGVKKMTLSQGPHAYKVIKYGELKVRVIRGPEIRKCISLNL